MFKLLWVLVKNLPRMAVAGAGAGMAWSAFKVDHHLPLPSPLPGARLAAEDGQGGTVALYHDERGEGTPVLLVHSVNAAASAFEMRPLYTRLQGTRPVWALDLPGYGLSERGERSYTPALMAGAVRGALERIGGAHVVALSLGSEFAARVAVDQPDLVRSLALLSPTGFGPSRQRSPVVGSVLRFPLWAQAVYDGIASRRSIRYFLSQSFSGPVDDEMVDYAYRTSHQPGARFAPLAFLANELFTPDAVDRLYAHVRVPTVVLYDRDPFTGFVRLPEFLSGRSSWTAMRIAGTSGLPHWDRPTETMQALTEHWSAAEEEVGTAPGSVDTAEAADASSTTAP